MIEELHIQRVRDHSLREMWPKLKEDLVHTEMQWGEFETLESIENDLFEETLQYWILHDSEKILMQCMTRMLNYPVGRALRVVWAYGAGAKNAVLMMESVEQLARNLGCFRFEVTGRDGWIKLLKPYGYERIAQIIGRDLTKPIMRDS